MSSEYEVTRAAVEILLSQRMARRLLWMQRLAASVGGFLLLLCFACNTDKNTKSTDYRG